MGIQKAALWAAVALAVSCAAPRLRAGVTTTGDVSPDPTTSTATTDVYVGNTADGSVTIDAGTTVVSNNSYLGYVPGVNGAVTVTGNGSTWGDGGTGGGTFYVGYSGNGTVNIAAGGTINSTVYLGFNAGSSGQATVSGAGSAWAGGFYVGNDGAGTLTVNNGGTISGYGYIGFDPGSTGIVTLDGAGSAWTQGIGGIYVGGSGAGLLQIVHGAAASSDSGNIGSSSGGTGTVNVDGAGSQWTGMTGGLYAGVEGPGNLNITHGGIVSSDSGYVGGNVPQATGRVTIDGAGSAWTDNQFGVYVGGGGAGTVSVTNGGRLDSAGGYVGLLGAGSVAVDGPGSLWNNTDRLEISANSSVSISHGGKVTATSLSLDDPSALLTMTVGDGSSLDLGTGSVSNNGIIRLAAAPIAVAGNTYFPMTAAAGATWGTVQALGGSWNGNTSTFTISSAASGNAGTHIDFDLAQQQRVIVTDPATGKTVIASFSAATTSNPLDFVGTPLTSEQAALLPPDQTLLAGWTFSASGYTEGDPVYLSLDVGPGFTTADFSTWHYDGTTWSDYTPTDFTYDGQYASFTVSGFSGYAVTTPEPASLAILAFAGMALLAFRRPGSPKRT